ncbi:MAG: imelysin family protein [Phocaeicola sp.]|nr:hypothetical protein [Phocaeicola oris]
MDILIINMKLKLFFLCFFIFSLCVLSCNNNEEKIPITNEINLNDVLIQVVDATINPIHDKLMTKVDELFVQLTLMKKDKTQDNVNKACSIFLEARALYELTEAFQLGPNSFNSVDANINSWPMDYDEYNNHVANGGQTIDKDGAMNIDALSSSVKGFHAIEYVLFREGKNRNINDITDIEMSYALGVSHYICDEFSVVVKGWNSGDKPFKQNFYSIGQSNSIYKTVKAASEAILIGDSGCAGISDEIAYIKLGEPYNKNSYHYIESPHSYTSIEDLEYNLQGIECIWYGGYDNLRNENKSFHAWFIKKNIEICKLVEDAIENAKVEIKKIPAPFVYNYNNSQVGNAINACNNLTEALEKAIEYM